MARARAVSLETLTKGDLPRWGSGIA